MSFLNKHNLDNPLIMFIPLLIVIYCSCMDDNVSTPDPNWVGLFSQDGVRIDTVGVRNLAQWDSSSSHHGLVIVDRQYTFPPESKGGEVFAWEFYAETLDPVKLILVRYDKDSGDIEVIGESATITPKAKGVNRHVLYEPIPIAIGCMMGIVQPKGGTIPFRKLTGYKTLISSSGFNRPFMKQNMFAMYGWRYASRVFWRQDIDVF